MSEFYSAVYRGDLSAARELSRNPTFDVNGVYDGFPALYAACSQGNAEMVRFLLGLKGLDHNIQTCGPTPFYKACFSGHVVVISVLLAEEKVDVNRPFRDGVTPFYQACSDAQVAVVELLLTNPRVDVNRATDDKLTPLFFACDRGHVNVVKLLLASQRVDINKPWKSEETPFYRAAQNGHLPVIQCFLSSGRDIEAEKKPTFSGVTAAAGARLLGASTERSLGESEEDFQRKKANFLKIADLIDAYVRGRTRSPGQRREEGRFSAPAAAPTPPGSCSSLPGAPGTFVIPKPTSTPKTTPSLPSTPASSNPSKPPEKWSTAEVVAWLRDQGHPNLGSVALEHGWDGMILLALNSTRADAAAYRSDCADLGLSALPLQVKLKGILVALFEDRRR